MLKNSKQNNENTQKIQRKKELKMYSSNSITTLKYSEKSKKISKNLEKKNSTKQKKTIKKQG